MSENTEVIQAPSTAPVKAKPPVAVGDRGIVIADIDAMWRWANYVAASGLAPKGIEKPEAIFVATQMGLEVGLSPMAALQNIAVINGRPSIWGDAQLAVVRSTGELEEFAEWYEVAGQRTNRNPASFDDTTTAVCRVKRRGYDAQESAFSVADAKKAGLWGKAGPWSQYPARMLRFRARSFSLRDSFGDALRGMLSAEEAQDLPAAIDVTPRRSRTVVVDTQAALPQFRAPAAVQAAPVAEATPAPVEVAQPQHEAAQEAPTEPPADDSPFALNETQAAVERIVVEAGATFDTLKLALKSSNLINADAWGSYADIPDGDAKRMVNGKAGLVRMIKAAKGGNQ